ncbi:hypothetical protein HK096_006926, partial [Nowakowskiella sp. JEL0078]
MVLLIVVGGVSGCGKSSLGLAISKAMTFQNKICVFLDADDFHSNENKNKMSAGVPLTDEDRLPWLESIGTHIKSLVSAPICAPSVIILACSALKHIYRDIFRSLEISCSITVLFILFKRLEERRGHFVNSKLLESQLNTYELPTKDESDIFSLRIEDSRSIEETALDNLSNLVNDFLGTNEVLWKDISTFWFISAYEPKLFNSISWFSGSMFTKMLNSASLLADALHSTSDMVSDFATLFVYNRARRAPDQTHPFGYGKLEPMGSLGISGILVSSGIGMGYHSILMLTDIWNHSGVIVSEHLSSIDWSTMSPVALGILVISIFVKELLFRMTLSAGQKLKSDILIANAYHHRADAASSIVALVGVSGSVFGFPLLDPIGGVIVSGMIIQTGASMIIPATKQLLDVEISTETKNKINELIEELALEEKNIIQCSDIRSRTQGPYTL